MGRSLRRLPALIPYVLLVAVEVLFFESTPVNGSLLREDAQWYSMCTESQEACASADARPSARSRHAATSIYDSMFIFGGEGDSVELSTSLKDDLWHYSLTQHRWLELCANCTARPSPRKHASLTVVEHESGDNVDSYTVYMYGGGNDDGSATELVNPEETILDDFWSFSVDISPDGEIVRESGWVELCAEDSTCRRGGSFPGRRYLSSMTAIGGQLYLYGGAYPNTNDVWTFDVARGEWTEVCPTYLPGYASRDPDIWNEAGNSTCCGRDYADRCPVPYATYNQMARIDDEAFVIYENDSGTPFVFNTTTGKWQGLCTSVFCLNRGTPASTSSSSSSRRDAPRMAVVDGTILLEGGVDANGAGMNDVWLFDVDQEHTRPAPMWERRCEPNCGIGAADADAEPQAAAPWPEALAFSSLVALTSERESGVVVVFGGEVGDEASDTLWVYAQNAPMTPPAVISPTVTPPIVPPTTESTATPELSTDEAAAAGLLENPVLLGGIGGATLIGVCTIVGAFAVYRRRKTRVNEMLEEAERAASARTPNVIEMAAHVEQVRRERIGEYTDAIPQEESVYDDGMAGPNYDATSAFSTLPPKSLVDGIYTDSHQQTATTMDWGEPTPRHDDQPHSVEEFLRDLRLEEYATRFLNEGFDSIDSLSLITEADLVEFGVARGHQRLLMNALRDLQVQYTHLSRTRRTDNSGRSLNTASSGRSSQDLTMQSAGRSAPISPAMSALQLSARSTPLPFTNLPEKFHSVGAAGGEKMLAVTPTLQPHSSRSAGGRPFSHSTSSGRRKQRRPTLGPNADIFMAAPASPGRERDNSYHRRHGHGSASSASSPQFNGSGYPPRFDRSQSGASIASHGSGGSISSPRAWPTPKHRRNHSNGSSVGGRSVFSFSKEYIDEMPTQIKVFDVTTRKFKRGRSGLRGGSGQSAPLDLHHIDDIGDDTTSSGDIVAV